MSLSNLEVSNEPITDGKNNSSVVLEPPDTINRKLWVLLSEKDKEEFMLSSCPAEVDKEGEESTPFRVFQILIYYTVITITKFGVISPIQQKKIS